MGGARSRCRSRPRDAFAQAALSALEARGADVAALRDALTLVLDATTDPRLQRVVVPDSPLADYLRGLYAWAHAVVRALDDVAASLRSLDPDWALYRSRVEEANNFHFDELHDAVGADLESRAIVVTGGAFGSDIPPIDELRLAVARLFVRASILEERLEQRLG